MTAKEREALVAIGGHLMKIQDIAKELDKRWGGTIATQAVLLDVQAHEALRLARAALAAREEQPSKPSEAFLRAVLDVIEARGDQEPRGALTYVANMAKDALSRKDTERPDEHWTLWICNECGWTTASRPPRALCCSVEPHKNQSMTSIRVVRDTEWQESGHE